MGFRWPWWPFNKSRGDKNGHKTVHIVFGFFFIVNFCLGIGSLGIPYTFFYSGLLAAIPTMVIISIVSWVNANYLLEVMARAQALEYWDNTKKPPSESDESDSELDQKQLCAAFLDDQTVPVNCHPKFEITIKRKFEIVELCEIFFNKYIKYIYLSVLSMHGFLSCWSYAAVAGSAWAINIPFRHFGVAESCSDNAFLHRTLPTDGCLYAYYFCLALFAIVVVTLSLLDLKEQAFIQLILGLMRFFTFAAIALYCIVRLIQGGDPCLDSVTYANTSYGEPTSVDVRSVVLKFDPRGWVLAVPVFTFSFLFHTGISSLTHPVRQKKYLHWLVIAMFISSLICYISLGISASLWFRSSIQETCTLNWAVFTGHGHSFGLQFFSYYIIIFPSFDVISAYPLIVHTVVNNFYILITGHDTSRKPKYRFDFLLRVFLRFIIALLPILAAFGVANLIFILKYTGLVGFICFAFPFSLQLRSIQVCKKEFSKVHISLSGSHSPEKEIFNEEQRKKGTITPQLEEHQFSLLAKDIKGEDNGALYMTPYSNVVISRPISVWAVGIVGALLFVLAFASLFLHPKKLTCDFEDSQFY